MTRFASYAATVAASPLSFGARLGRRLFAGRQAAPLIDPETLPDTLRRDLGFLEGRVAGRRDPRWD
jgi:hypothetical protein